MKITQADVGRTFLNRDGYQVTIVEIRKDDIFPIQGKVQHPLHFFIAGFREDGTYLTSGNPSGMDLMEAVVEPPVETLRGIVSFPGASGAPIAKVDVDFRDGKIVAVRLVEHG